MEMSKKMDGKYERLTNAAILAHSTYFYVFLAKVWKRLFCHLYIHHSFGLVFDLGPFNNWFKS